MPRICYNETRQGTTNMEKGGKPVLFWCILVWLTGILYLWMGAMIRFRGQYDLINNFWADQKSGKLDEIIGKYISAE